MKATRKRYTKLVWSTALIAVIVSASACYFVTRQNANKHQATTTKEVNEVSSQNKPLTAGKEAVTGTVIKTGDSQYGPMLFDNRGQAIYIWQLEDSSTAECYGNCAQEWPPVLTNDAPVASGDVNTQLLGTTKRTDGTTQVTYNGHPLYFYAHEKPGEVECHNIRTHGGLWWVIQPNGIRAS